VSLILIVEDNPDIASALAENLAAEGHRVRTAPGAAEALAQLGQERPSLVILDLMLPDGRGEEVLAGLRSQGLACPVLILSALTDEPTKVRGFRLGADDYVTKPFGLLELLARVDSLLRRSGTPWTGGPVVRLGAVEILPGARRVCRAGTELNLRPKELDLLLALLRQPNRVVPRRQLLDEVWGYEPSVESRTIDWHVAELRRKIEPDPAMPVYLKTVRKVGYRLDLPGRVTSLT